MCENFQYAGQTMRIVGRISTTVQTIVDGIPVGNMQLKATVVRDLKSLFGTEALPGEQLRGKLAKFEKSQDISELKSIETKSKKQKSKKSFEHSKPEPTKKIDVNDESCLNEIPPSYFQSFLAKFNPYRATSVDTPNSEENVSKESKLPKSLHPKYPDAKSYFDARADVFNDEEFEQYVQSVNDYVRDRPQALFSEHLVSSPTQSLSSEALFPVNKFPDPNYSPPIECHAESPARSTSSCSSSRSSEYYYDETDPLHLEPPKKKLHYYGRCEPSSCVTPSPPTTQPTTPPPQPNASPHFYKDETQKNYAKYMLYDDPRGGAKNLYNMKFIPHTDLPHGPIWCRELCCDFAPEDRPEECGHTGQDLPRGFQACSFSCTGRYCPCIASYAGWGGYWS